MKAEESKVKVEGDPVVAGAVARLNQKPLQSGFTVSTVNPGSPRRVNQETFQNLVMQALQMRRIYREAFILCDIRGYSHAEAAAIIGVDEPCIRRRLRSARNQIRHSNGLQP